MPKLLNFKRKDKIKLIKNLLALVFILTASFLFAYLILEINSLENKKQKLVESNKISESTILTLKETIGELEKFNRIYKEKIERAREEKLNSIWMSSIDEYNVLKNEGEKEKLQEKVKSLNLKIQMLAHKIREVELKITTYSRKEQNLK